MFFTCADGKSTHLEFHGTLTLNKGDQANLVFWKALYAIVLNVTHFDHKALFSAK